MFNGAPLMPLYHQSATPSILPTTPLNVAIPTGNAGGKGSKNHRSKRAVGDSKESLLTRVGDRYAAVRQAVIAPMFDVHHLAWADTMWWIGVGCTSLGTLLYFFF